MSSMLLRPTSRNAPWSRPARRDETLTIGSPRVFHTAPPQPASNARSIIEPMFVGGAEASQKGLGDLIPAKLMLRSAIKYYLHCEKGAPRPVLRQINRQTSGWDARGRRRCTGN